MTLTLTRKEEADIRRRRASKRRQKIDGPKLVARPKPTADDGTGYMAWLHHDIPCIACLILGPGSGPIEAAHQKLQLADRGFHRRVGRRGPHWTCVPLCAGHHRLGSPCCDPAQAKFWSVLAIAPETLADFIEALNDAYRADEPGAPVVQRFAQRRAA